MKIQLRETQNVIKLALLQDEVGCEIDGTQITSGQLSFYQCVVVLVVTFIVATAIYGMFTAGLMIKH